MGKAKKAFKTYIFEKFTAISLDGDDILALLDGKTIVSANRRVKIKIKDKEELVKIEEVLLDRKERESGRGRCSVLDYYLSKLATPDTRTSDADNWFRGVN